jgi:hypothetical protein
MIPQSTATEQDAGQDQSLQEALVSLLIAAARADGTVSAHEANSIEHIVAGMQLFRDHRGAALHKVFASASQRVKDDGVPWVVEAAAAIIPKELRTTAFALAIDLMLSDGRLTPREERFADDLRTLLSVDPETATRTIDVLRTKNAG